VRYTLRGLRGIIPQALLFVTKYWVRKVFQRADRYLDLYAMEKEALPFPLREFMIKCWRRHRDVPTRIDQVVDRAVEDLLYRQHTLRERMTKNKIDGQSLVKVENLLHSCFEATQNLSDDSHADVQKLKEKIENIKDKQATQENKFENAQLRFVALHKKSRLGVRASLTGNVLKVKLIGHRTNFPKPHDHKYA
jgi:hypothetical protein